MFIFLSGDEASKLPLSHHQVGFGNPGGSVARDGNPIGYDESNYHLVTSKIIYEAMKKLSGCSELPISLEEITRGVRFPAELEKLLPFI